MFRYKRPLSTIALHFLQKYSNDMWSVSFRLRKPFISSVMAKVKLHDVVAHYNMHGNSLFPFCIR